MKPKFAIIGGGICGLCTAIALKNLDLDFVLLESSNLRPDGAGIGLASNAIKALEILGIRDEIEANSLKVNSFSIADESGKQIIRPKTDALAQKYQLDNFAIHRYVLHEILSHQIDSARIKLNYKVFNWQEKNDKIILEIENKPNLEVDYAIVANGVSSKLRQILIPNSQPKYAGYTCWRGIVKWQNSAEISGVETWGSNGRFGITPLKNDIIYWYACKNCLPNGEKFKSFTIKDLLENFKNYHGIIPKLIEKTLEKDLIRHDIFDLKPLKKWHFNKILLLGDAAHATTPNLGQGACMGIEDAAVLMQKLKENQSVEQAFSALEKSRLKRTAYVIKTSKFAGEVAQIENPFLQKVRNSFLRIMPNFVENSQLKALYNTDFMAL